MTLNKAILMLPKLNDKWQELGTGSIVEYNYGKKGRISLFSDPTIEELVAAAKTIGCRIYWIPAVHSCSAYYKTADCTKYIFVGNFKNEIKCINAAFITAIEDTVTHKAKELK